MQPYPKKLQEKYSTTTSKTSKRMGGYVLIHARIWWACGLLGNSPLVGVNSKTHDECVKIN